MPTTTTSLDQQDSAGMRGAPSADMANSEDEYWRLWYWRERYYDQRLDYEDYAPAFRVGYIGYSQYGGKFDDAQLSLCADWERIKGDSRLTLDEALKAMRSAWARLAARQASRASRAVFGRGNDPTYLDGSVLQARREAHALSAEPARSHPA
jgi:hypothetical protein